MHGGAFEGKRLLLDGDDGRHASFGIVRPDAGSDGVLIIGGDAYLKRAPG